MTKLIAETAWHHQGDYIFMCDLVSRICEDTTADIVKMHITLDLDEYMLGDHDAYDLLKSWLLSPAQWEELIKIVRNNDKHLMLLLNDTSAIDFASGFEPELVEIHSVCLNVPPLQEAVIEYIGRDSKIVIGVGGCSLEEVDSAVSVFRGREIVLMFGFQNYPTKYEEVNLRKIRKIQSLYPGKMFGYADHTGWDEDNNELITLMVASNGMDYVEKHVTTSFGIKRCDYSAAISIEMFNSLAGKINIMDRLVGDGSILLNPGEKAYSQYGPMKMAAVMEHEKPAGTKLALSDFRFCRTKQHTSMSQIDVVKSIGQETKEAVSKDQIIDRNQFKD